jgi:hypothetical protein
VNSNRLKSSGDDSNETEIDFVTAWRRNLELSNLRTDVDNGNDGPGENRLNARVKTRKTGSKFENKQQTSQKQLLHQEILC